MILIHSQLHLSLKTQHRQVRNQTGVEPNWFRDAENVMTQGVLPAGTGRGLYRTPPATTRFPPAPSPSPTIQDLAFLSSISQASVALESSQMDSSKPQQVNQKEQELSLSAKSAGTGRRPWCSAVKAFIFCKAQQLPRVEKNGMRTFWPDSLKSLLPPSQCFPHREWHVDREKGISGNRPKLFALSDMKRMKKNNTDSLLSN